MRYLPGLVLLVAFAAMAAEPIPATVSINGAARGTVMLTQAGPRLMVPLADFKSWGILEPPADSILQHEGGATVALDRIPGLTATFDDKVIALRITVAAELLPRTDIDLRWRYGEALHPEQPSAFLNYSITAANGATPWMFTTEAGGRLGNTFAYTSGNYREGQGYTRLLTSFTHDDKDKLRRITVGDITTLGAELAGSLVMGGLSISSFFALDPFLVRYPTAHLNTIIDTPSQLEVRIDGAPVARRNVAPGPLDISGITGLAGARDVQVVVRDAFGREQIYNQPFYFSDVALREGLHEYSYNAGWLRENFGTASNDYGTAAFTGFHRYGYSNTLTLGATAEAREGTANAGPGATLLTPYGVMGANFMAGSGLAGSLGYGYRAGPFSVNAVARRFSHSYKPLSGPAADLSSVATSYSFGSASIASASFTRSEPKDLAALNTLGFGYQLDTRPGVLFFSYTKRTGQFEGWNAGITFHYFWEQYYAVAGVSSTGSTQGRSLYVARSVPIGEGYGWNFGGSQFRNGETLNTDNAFAQYNGRYGALIASYQDSNKGESTATATLAGGLGCVPGRCFASRPLNQAFAVVKVADVAGVPVRANGADMGETDEHGEAIATRLNSFYPNSVEFDAKALPLDYAYKRSTLHVATDYRAGVYLEFPVRKLRAITGRLEHEGKPMENAAIRLTRGTLRVDTFTDSAGELYADDITPGEWRLTVGGVCGAVVTVPESKETVTELGTIQCI